jgi:hypothetical protein
VEHHEEEMIFYSPTGIPIVIGIAIIVFLMVEAFRLLPKGGDTESEDP